MDRNILALATRVCPRSITTIFPFDNSFFPLRSLEFAQIPARDALKISTRYLHIYLHVFKAENNQ